MYKSVTTLQSVIVCVEFWKRMSSGINLWKNKSVIQCNPLDWWQTTLYFESFSQSQALQVSRDYMCERKPPWNLWLLSPIFADN